MLKEVAASSLGVAQAESLSQTRQVSSEFSRELGLHTSLMSLIAIQLFPESTRSSNNRGANGKKSCGRLHPSSQTTFTMAAVTLESSFSSIRRSFIFGHAGLKVSGYTRARRYTVTIVFFRIIGLEWLRRGSKSDSTDIANDEVITCGKVMIGRVMVVSAGETISWAEVSS